MGQDFRLTRVDLIDRVRDDYRRGDHHWLGEESRWLANVPLMYRALASPMAGGEFVRTPRPGEDFFDSNRFAYWGSLLHLLGYSLGWRYPALGLEWWVANKRPVEDPRFALIEQTWVADGHFDSFCAWLWINPGIAIDGSWSPAHYVELREAKSRQWFVAVGNCDVDWSPFGGWKGASDPLHLVSHIGPLSLPDPEGIGLALDPDGAPRGTLVAPRLRGWYSFLSSSELLNTPHPSGRSWRIDVVVKPVGWLGTYRRSRETGRWFSGPHSAHIVGNRP